MAVTPGTEPILDAARRWRDRCLLDELSVFTDEPLWTTEYLHELKQHFIDNPDFGSGTFLEKLQLQLSGASGGARKLGAEMLWVTMLFPNNVNRDTKRSMVRTVWDWSGDVLPDDHSLLEEPLRQGVGSGGMGYNNYRWAELTFFILLMQDWRERPRSEQEALLSDPWKFCAWLDTIPGAQNRQLRHMLLHLLFPDTFERISSGGHKAKVDAAFSPLLDGQGEKGTSLLARDRRLLQVRRLLEQEYPGQHLDFYLPPLSSRWVDDDGDDGGTDTHFPGPKKSPGKVREPPAKTGSEVPKPSYTEPDFAEIVTSIGKQGLRIDERAVRRYHHALKVRGFVILSGVSGTGKTWLAEAYATAVGARHRIVPVAPNWTTNEDLLGYLNPLDGEYHDTPFSRFLREAAAEYESARSERRRPKPFHLVLDEMNLARVEYYFARFLSAMEVRARHEIAAIELGPEDTVVLPPNLLFIGTVNVDETTHGFADKVYDRAQLIELEVSRDALAAHLGDAPYAELLLELWDELGAVAPFAFRVVDEIGRYVSVAIQDGGSWQESLDEQVLQKILPKLKGTDPRLGETLGRLATLLPEPEFPLSHRKLKKMHDGFLKHGFASYF
jgi:hypothetical protein